MGRQLGWIEALPGVLENEDALAAAAALLALACEKHYYFRLRYRPTNTEYVWGRRATPFGVVNFPPEMEQLERMIAARERAMWELDVRDLADAAQRGVRRLGHAARQRPARGPA